MTSPARRHPPGPPRPDVACPGCGAAPRVGQLWHCAPDGCGAPFDTFATRGRCPRCGAAFVWTQCAACHGHYPHQAWYHGGTRDSVQH